jgi:hypothetical protein
MKLFIVWLLFFFSEMIVSFSNYITNRIFKRSLHRNVVISSDTSEWYVCVTVGAKRKNE